LSIYQLASIIKRTFAITGKEKQFHDFILNFLVEVGRAMESPTHDSPSPFLIYGTARSSSADSRTSLEQRTDVILAKFLEFVPDLKTKDPSRAFDYWQRLAIYYKDRGICQLCANPTPFDQGEADHIVRHADGGQTTVANGRWLCSKCNKRISKIPTPSA